MRLIKVLFLFFLSQSAFASSWYFFEPAVGYYQGHFNASKVSGLGFDIKLGINWDRLYIGADVLYAQDLNVSGVSYELDAQNTGLVIGYNASALRVWYTLVSSASNSYKNGAIEYQATGGGSKLGIGGKISGNTYLNLEANFLEYEELSTDGTKTDVDYFMDLVLLSVSWVL